ncbi:MAG TPA: hypothetical protein VMT17_09290 [Anaeromyxobacteraceae bacterium]|nr:hypothetical protein [Anaeromyxobacteraceae bacterium]
MAHPRPALLALLLASCAAAPPPPRPPLEPERAAARPPPVAPGMDAAALRRAWGEPVTVRKVPSPTAAGLLYEVWSWGRPGEGREALLVDGRVVDVLDPAPAATESGAAAPR